MTTCDVLWARPRVSVRARARVRVRRGHTCDVLWARPRVRVRLKGWARARARVRRGHTCDVLLARALSTDPSAESERLMACVSLSAAPVVCAFESRSEPARSTRESCHTRQGRNGGSNTEREQRRAYLDPHSSVIISPEGSSVISHQSSVIIKPRGGARGGSDGLAARGPCPRAARRCACWW
jgi:hypothetical protein